MSVTLTKITPTQHTSAVQWIIRTFMTELIGDTWVDEMTAQQAYRVVQRHYEGGWNQFAQDLGDDTCDGHPADEFSPMGETVYCDGSCS